jgi:hypothetical protein
MHNNHPTSPGPEALTLVVARPLAFVLAAGVVLAGGLGWGRPGLLAAFMGASLSLVNIWVLARLGARAAERALVDGPVQAASGLQAALGGKTVVLLVTVALVARVIEAGNVTAGGTPMLPFALGLLVTVVALVIAGLAASALDSRRVSKA